MFHSTLCPNKEWTPNQIAIIQYKLVSFIWNFRRNNCISSPDGWHINLEKMYDNVNFINILKHITKNGLYNTAFLLWKFQSLLQSDELFCECPVHFLGLTPAPQLKQCSEQSESYAFYHCQVSDQQNRTEQINLRQQLLQRWQVFVRKLFDKHFLLHDPFLDAKL